MLLKFGNVFECQLLWTFNIPFLDNFHFYLIKVIYIEF